MGTGRIARAFATALETSRTGVLAAIGSRTPEAAAQFAETFPARCHGHYEALLADPEVDAIYLSTPHPMHAEWAIRTMEASKHLLCEKPMTMNHADTLRVIEAARRHDVFLMEAFMYRCQPQTAKVMELIRQGALGEVRLVRASFGFAAPFNPAHRLYNPALGGGGILDIGCYPMSMARLVAGAASGEPFAEPQELLATGTLTPTGVDESAAAILKFPGGLIAQLTCSLAARLDNTVAIHGTEATLSIPTPWHAQGQTAGSTRLSITRNGETETIEVPADRGIYTIEADHVAEHLAARQSPCMPWDDSLGQAAALDRWLAALA